MHRQHGDEPAAIEERVTGIDHFAAGTVGTGGRAEAGEIVRLHGLRAARIGDRLGVRADRQARSAAAVPAAALESVVRPTIQAKSPVLRTALEQLAEQDPLISLRQRNEAGEISVRLYGEVQKEVLSETLASEYGVGRNIRPEPDDLHRAPLAAEKQPRYIGGRRQSVLCDRRVSHRTGDVWRSDIRLARIGRVAAAFYRASEETVYETLTQGLCGWEVTDCRVTLTQRGMSAREQPQRETYR